MLVPLEKRTTTIRLYDPIPGWIQVEYSHHDDAYGTLQVILDATLVSIIGEAVPDNPSDPRGVNISTMHGHALTGTLPGITIDRVGRVIAQAKELGRKARELP